MLRYDRQTKPGLVALYDIRPGNGAGPLLQPRSPHAAHGQTVKFTQLLLATYWLEPMKIKLLCPRGTQTCALAMANVAYALYLSGCHSRSSHQVWWQCHHCRMTSPPFPATPISYKGVKCPLFREVKGVNWAFLTAHAHKRPKFYFRSKIWRHHHFRRPRFPIRGWNVQFLGRLRGSFGQFSLRMRINGHNSTSGQKIWRHHHFRRPQFPIRGWNVHFLGRLRGSFGHFSLRMRINGHNSTSGQKSDVTTISGDPDFL